MVRLCICTFLLGWSTNGFTQDQPTVYTVKNGRMYIHIDKQINDAALEQFIIKFALEDLSLKKYVRGSGTDSLVKAGWKIEKNDRQFFVISKKLDSYGDLTDPADKILFAEKQHLMDEFSPVSNEIHYGQNKFRNKHVFAVKDSLVTFFHRGSLDADNVVLSGSFIDWSPTAWRMTKTDSGWIRQVRLTPGKYWYKFIIDGRWIVDNDNTAAENDGRGNVNSVFFKTNTVFKLQGFSNAKKVYLAGSFNSWRPRELEMIKTAAGWELPVYLADGTHTYRFVVDGKWLADPGNPNKLPNEFNDVNSVIQIGKPHIFRLNGYADAKQVMLSGSFNQWRKDQLAMKKAGTGWELPYVLGPGNYEYKFVVDGKWVTDPNNTQSNVDVNINPGTSNSYLIIQPNYTFRLKGFTAAKSVYLAGDFNDWTPNSLAMKKQGNEWVFQVHLSPGKHVYKFIVDGKWIIDPGNELWEQNEHRTGNSVLWIERRP